MSKIDRVFILASDLECAKVRTAIDYDAVMDDDFRGKEDQELYVLTALSPEGMKELLGKYGIDEHGAPVVLTHDGTVIPKAKNVLMHLRRNGMIRDGM